MDPIFSTSFVYSIGRGRSVESPFHYGHSHYRVPSTRSETYENHARMPMRLNTPTWLELVRTLSDRDIGHLQDLIGLDQIESLCLMQSELETLNSILDDICSDSNDELELVLTQISTYSQYFAQIAETQDPVIQLLNSNKFERSQPMLSGRRRSIKLSAAAALTGDQQALIDIRRALVAEEAQLRSRINQIRADIDKSIVLISMRSSINLLKAKQTLEFLRRRFPSTESPASPGKALQGRDSSLKRTQP